MIRRLKDQTFAKTLYERHRCLETAKIGGESGEFLTERKERKMNNKRFCFLVLMATVILSATAVSAMARESGRYQAMEVKNG